MAQPAADTIEANNFDLRGDSITVRYSTATLTGSNLYYRDGQVDRTFGNEELTVEETRLGQLITVTIRHVPDLEIVTFTLVLPRITVVRGEAPINIESMGVTVTNRTTLGGPKPGQQTFYSSVTLSGTAEWAVF